MFTVTNLIINFVAFKTELRIQVIKNRNEWHHLALWKNVEIFSDIIIHFLSQYFLFPTSFLINNFYSFIVTVTHIQLYMCSRSI